MRDTTTAANPTTENWAEAYGRGPDYWEQSLAIAGCTGHNIERLKPQNTTPALEAAMALVIFRGWKIFPARMEDGKKWSWLSAKYAPGGENWGMTNDPEQLVRNFVDPKWRLKCGVGVPTGAVNGFFVVETDTKAGHDVDGQASLQALESRAVWRNKDNDLPVEILPEAPQQGRDGRLYQKVCFDGRESFVPDDELVKHGKLPDTLMAMSPSGSVHRYFKHPGGNIKIGDPKGEEKKIAPGVDVKGDGGMVIAPPSVAPASMRVPGVYKWINQLPIADAPQWLLDLVTENASAASSGDRFKRVNEWWDYDDTKSPTQKLNDAAIANYPAWVPELFPTAKRYHDGYRVSSANLGRELEEDLSLVSEGIVDYGVHDLDDPLEGKRTPVQIVMEHLFEVPVEEIAARSNITEFEKACAWLRERLGIEAPKQEPAAPPLKTRLMQTSAEFVAGFVPPDYLVDGLLQRRYVYSLTAPTGSGKTALGLRIAAHVALGLPLGNLEVEQGRVLFFAGENPDDVRARWIMLCEEMKQDPDAVDVVFMPFTLKLSDKEIGQRIDAEAAEHGPFSLLIVDTSASYYTGDDENDNVALGNHARMLRTFIKLPGGPTVLVTCHPTKTPNMDNLLPRGGGAFLAEVDGNLVCIKDLSTMTVEVTTHGKFRGPDFAPFSFRLVAGQSEKLVDSKGRSIWSIFAQPITNEDVEMIKRIGRDNQDELLRVMLDQPGKSLPTYAEQLHWLTMQGEPSKQKVHRVMMKLKNAKLVELTRDDRYVLTPKGKQEAEKTPVVAMVVEHEKPRPRVAPQRPA